MFTKEKLEKWIEALEEHIWIDKRFFYEFEGSKILQDAIDERKSNLEDLIRTLEQIYTSITSDGSI